MHRKADDVSARIDVDQRAVFQSRGVDLDEAAHVPVVQFEPPTQGRRLPNAQQDVAEGLSISVAVTDRSDWASNDAMFRPCHYKMLRRSEPLTWHAHATLCSLGYESRASRPRAPAPTDLA